MYPLVSVIIPFYNRLNYLRNAIKSVKIQTYQNFEIILINDASNESFLELNKEISIDERIKLISNKKNQGPSFCRNLGINNSNGSYVAFLDSDDEWLDFKLKEQVEFMIKNNLDFCFSDYYKRNLNTGSNSRVKLPISYSMPFMAFSCAIATPTVICKKEILRKVGFRNDIRYGEDIICWANISKITELKSFRKATTIVNRSINSSSTNIKIQLEASKNINKYLFEDKKIISLMHKIYFQIRVLLKFVTKI